jgi:hypothetical protein
MTQLINGSNIQSSIDDLDKEMAKLGGQSVNVARPKLGLALIKAAFDGVINEDDVPARYDAYLAGRLKVQRKQELALGDEQGNGKAANVSKCRQLVKAGGLPAIDFPSVIDRAVKLRTAMVGGDDKIEAPFDMMVKAAREQQKTPTVELTDEQLQGLIAKATPAEKTLLDKLIAAYKSMHKLSADNGDNVPLQEAVDDLSRAITEAGGEVPAMTKEDKALAAFKAECRARGLEVKVERIPAAA